MHSIKATWSGRTLALAKPNESGGKKSRNRIPREERKALMESFIKKHQRLNNGDFPSLSLTHREVGGSFYTIREIFREIIQENRVLGPAELIFEEKGTAQEQKQSQSSSIFTGPVAPLSLPLNGSSLALDHRQHMREKLVVVPNACSSEAEAVKTLANGAKIDGEGWKDRESRVVVCRESEASKLLEENAGLLMQYSPCSSPEISEALPASLSENNVAKLDMAIQESVEISNDKVSMKPGEPGEKILENGKNVHGKLSDLDDREKGQMICSESTAAEPVKVEKKVKDAAAAMTEKMNITGSVSGTVTKIIDMSESMAIETFPLPDSCNGKSNELENASETGKGIEIEGTTLEVDSSSFNTISQDMSSATSATSSEKNAEVIVDQLASKSFVPLMNSECTNGEETVIIHTRINDIKETRESCNNNLSSRTTEQSLPRSSKESGKVENDATKADGTSNLIGGKAAFVHDTIPEEGNVDAPEESSSQKGSIATLNRIKPESWEGASKDIEGREMNPLVAVLKSFITALVKFWSE